jgi:intergrase/recombinase
LDQSKGKIFLESATFFQKANTMTDDDVQKVTSQAVRKEYEQARVRTMPSKVKQSYLMDVAKYGGYANELARVEKETAERAGRETTERVERETTERVQREMVTRLIASGMSIAQVAAVLDKMEEEIRSVCA